MERSIAYYAGYFEVDLSSLIRTDSQKRKRPKILNCKLGYKQRGAACQPYLSKKDEDLLLLQREYSQMKRDRGIMMLVPHFVNIGRSPVAMVDYFTGKNAENRIKHNRKENTEINEYVKNRLRYNPDTYYQDIGYAERNKQKIKKMGLRHEEVASIREYTRPVEYKLINATNRGLPSVLDEVKDSHIYKKHNLSLDEITQIGKTNTDILTQALDKLPNYNGVSYRGGTLPLEKINELIKNKEYSDDGFTSTTKTFGTAYHGNVFFKILSKSGKDISSIEQMPNNEVLFKPKTKFKVKQWKKITKNNKDYYYFLLRE